MDEMSDQELEDLQRRAVETRGRWSRLSRVLGAPELDASYWIPRLVTELQRVRQRCAQLERDCARLQREYECLRYGPTPASPLETHTTTEGDETGER
jgi:hypothetical protein